MAAAQNPRQQRGEACLGTFGLTVPSVAAQDAVAMVGPVLTNDV